MNKIKNEFFVESIVFHSEFESIIYNEENHMIETTQRCSIFDTSTNSENESIHHVRFNSKRNHIMNQNIINVTIDEKKYDTKKCTSNNHSTMMDFKTLMILTRKCLN